MRVIAGQFKGRRLKTPSWDGLRPTSDKLRETLFNILAPRIDGARFLDAFAGTGAVGIEALSRGASSVTFVDADRRATALIEQNLALCGIDSPATVQRGDVAAVVARFSPSSFDVIVLDPPYDYRHVGEVLDALHACLSPDGLIVLERASKREPDIPASLVRIRDVKSGDSTLTFLALRG
jgi:16S rRNA (guanine966-N2)-methyltransferase